MKQEQRSKDCIRFGILYTLTTTCIIALLFEACAHPLSQLFALSGGASESLVDVCARATRIAAPGFLFMGFTVAIQGVLQALGYALKPLVLSFLRLAVFVFPIAWFFARSSHVLELVWWTFPIAEVLTAVFSFLFLKSCTAKAFCSPAE